MCNVTGVLTGVLTGVQQLCVVNQFVSQTAAEGKKNIPLIKFQSDEKVKKCYEGATCLTCSRSEGAKSQIS